MTRTAAVPRVSASPASGGSRAAAGEIRDGEDRTESASQPQRVGLDPQPDGLREVQGIACERESLTDVEAVEVEDRHSRVVQQVQAPQPDERRGRNHGRGDRGDRADAGSCQRGHP